MRVNLEEALRRTAAQVDIYQVPQEVIALAAESLGRLPVPEREGLKVRALHEAIILIAEGHLCGRVECTTCETIRNGLAVALAAVRTRIDVEMERKLRG